MDKPFHLMTPEEKTKLRIEQNRAIAERIKSAPPAPVKSASRGAKSSAASSSSSVAEGSAGFTRATPEDHKGSVIRKMTS